MSKGRKKLKKSKGLLSNRKRVSVKSKSQRKINKKEDPVLNPASKLTKTKTKSKPKTMRCRTQSTLKLNEWPDKVHSLQNKEEELKIEDVEEDDGQGLPQIAL